MGAIAGAAEKSSSLPLKMLFTALRLGEGRLPAEFAAARAAREDILEEAGHILGDISVFRLVCIGEGRHS